MTTGTDLTVLCVDPDAEAREGLVAEFETRANFAPTAADSVGSALDTAESTAVDCIVAEYDLGDGTAFDLFEAARDHHPNVSCILFTDVGHADIDSGAFRDTVAEYLPKGGPNATDRLVDIVRNAVLNRTQVGFPLPPDEDERLEALADYDIDDLTAVESFDRFSNLIVSHFGISVAFVGLLDEEEERFVACHGADWETLTREDSICTYAVLDEDVTVVENVQADPRFEHNETLKQLDIRAYAGANLTTADGTVIGELCLIDDEPRRFTDEELTDLQLFAEEVSDQLELRRRLREEETESTSAEENS